jgi:hypothetical protein
MYIEFELLGHAKKQTGILLNLVTDYEFYIAQRKYIDKILMGCMRDVQNYVFRSIVVYTFALTLGIGKIYFLVEE